MLDAVVVGSGPNGLAAAIELARHGWSVRVLEAADTPGGGLRSESLLLPGHLHDVCAAVHPMAVASPFFRSLPLETLGVTWAHPRTPLAHPLDGTDAVVLDRSVEATAEGLGEDAGPYTRRMRPLVAGLEPLLDGLLRPSLQVPRAPLRLARFGARALRSATAAAGPFRGARARALFHGLAAHAILPLGAPMTAGVGWMMGATAHAVGWPFVAGGSGRLAAALLRHLGSLGGEVVVDHPVRSLGDLPASRVVLFDVSPEQLLAIAGDRLSPRYARALRRFRRASGVQKLDWVLDGPVPWSDARVAAAGTVHVGGTAAEVAVAEAEVAAGHHPDRPFVLLAQPSGADPTRAPHGRQVLWGYTHVPLGSTVDVTERIEAQIERFAPGFRDRIVARSSRMPADLARHNANQPGGDISGGVSDLRQHLARPILSPTPYATGDPRLWLCSASTPPGIGVHGMCGANAARAVLRRAHVGRTAPSPRPLGVRDGLGTPQGHP